MKRKAEEKDINKTTAPKLNGGASKKRRKNPLSEDDVRARFRAGLLEDSVREAYTNEYARASPYKHAVIYQLVDDKLLRSVRSEILANVEFTPKETDIYKIHQSGDLANLDGLDDESLARLPSLLALRDTIYSETFRKYISHITSCGPLSGRKTDMAINVYIPGCYLLCHDDVIGSRRVSYILYLTDPDKPWQPQWGGSLRLFPVEELKNKDGEVAKMPRPDPTTLIPPAWNQLSFFAVQPGESFHDVEEVYPAETQGEQAKDGARVRMAISGWFHIPQLGEDGYVEGEEEKNAENSSLMQLKGNPAQYDTPQPKILRTSIHRSGHPGFTESDLDYLLQYIAPNYLTPNALEQISQHFVETCSITIADILSEEFASRLKEYLLSQEEHLLPADSVSVEQRSPWKVARPPHKHRFLYQQAKFPNEFRSARENSPITELLDNVLQSRPFLLWLEFATGCNLESAGLVARRFRHGHDYTLASPHDGKPQLELTLEISPTWEEKSEHEVRAAMTESSSDGSVRSNDKAQNATRDNGSEETVGVGEGEDDAGGHEIYMAGNDGEGEDAAVYRAGGNEENILFFEAAAWNRLSLVLRDSGILKFVKYLSKHARGDRWDISGVFEVEEEVDEGEGAKGAEVPLGESDNEVEFHGFPSSEESDSD